MKMIYKSIA